MLRKALRTVRKRPNSCLMPWFPWLHQKIAQSFSMGDSIFWAVVLCLQRKRLFFEFKNINQIHAELRKNTNWICHNTKDLHNSCGFKDIIFDEINWLKLQSIFLGCCNARKGEHSFPILLIPWLYWALLDSSNSAIDCWIGRIPFSSAQPDSQFGNGLGTAGRSSSQQTLGFWREACGESGQWKWTKRISYIFWDEFLAHPSSFRCTK